MVWGSFVNATQGMLAFSHDLGLISQNISNVNTSGYKKVEATFQTLMSESAPSWKSMGVTTSDRKIMDRNGIIVGSDRWSDLGLNGQGFMMFNTQPDGSGEARYSRNGNLIPLLGPSEGGTRYSYLTNGDGGYLMGWAPDANGSFNSITPASATTAVRWDGNATSPGIATTAASIRATIPSDVAIGKVESISLPVYDSTMTARTLTMQFTKVSANAWDVTWNSPGSVSVTPSTPTRVTFDSNGDLAVTSPKTGSVALAWAGGATSTVAVDFTKVNQLASGMTEIGEIEQNGMAPGDLLSCSFDSQGIMSMRFTNGEIRPLFKLPVAQFQAAQNLESLNGTTFRATAESGTPLLTQVGDSQSATSFSVQAYETSNVDIGEQFTRMIMTQKAYSSNATVFKTSDEMLKAASDLM